MGVSSCAAFSAGAAVRSSLTEAASPWRRERTVWQTVSAAKAAMVLPQRGQKRAVFGTPANDPWQCGQSEAGKLPGFSVSTTSYYNTPLMERSSFKKKNMGGTPMPHLGAGR